jgi:hypothetical protein
MHICLKKAPWTSASKHKQKNSKYKQKGHVISLPILEKHLFLH